MTEQEIQEWKNKIDEMDQESMARLWRFSDDSHPIWQGTLFEYFNSRFKELGGFTPEISKRIGWQA